MKYAPLEKLPTDKAYLHFDALRISDEEVQVDYELVIPLGEVDCRGTFDHRGRKERPENFRHVWLDSDNNKRLPLGRTRIGASRNNYPISAHTGEIDLPFRDGVHSAWDNAKLGGLQIIYSVDGKHYTLLPR